MKTLYLDCGMGAAGDMLAAALVELLDDPDGFVAELNALGIPGVEYRRDRAETCGIVGAHMTVTVDGVEEGAHDRDHAHAGRAAHAHGRGHAHAPEHGDAHEHACAHHHHAGIRDVEHILRDHLDLPERVREDAIATYGLIAEAESVAHGVPVDEIHFHEVGTMDAIADVVAVCLAMHRLAPDEVVASAVNVGGGQVACAHGILPVPAPATAHILRDVPVFGGEIESELCTPTGAALLKRFVTRFGDMPVMRVRSIGYGIGTKRFACANCVRALLGETADAAADAVVTLSCTVDDMTAEEIGFAIETLLDAGALEAYTAPVTMKKSRPGALVTVMCREADRDRIVRLVFAHTTTIGIRESVERRYVLDRAVETASTPFGDVRKKVSTGYGVRREKLEYDDLARIAREAGLPLSDVRAYCSIGSA